MGVQQRVYRPVEFDFPKDFPERFRVTRYRKKVCRECGLV